MKGEQRGKNFERIMKTLHMDMCVGHRERVTTVCVSMSIRLMFYCKKTLNLTVVP